MPPGHYHHRSIPATERFWRRVNQSGPVNPLVGTPCWMWMTRRGPARQHYPFNVGGGRLVNVHRYAYELLVGPIPEDMQVLHHCDNPGCVNPNHLFLGDQLRNIKDAVRKGRQRQDLTTGRFTKLSTGGI